MLLAEVSGSCFDVFFGDRGWFSGGSSGVWASGHSCSDVVDVLDYKQLEVFEYIVAGSVVGFDCKLFAAEDIEPLGACGSDWFDGGC